MVRTFKRGGEKENGKRKRKTVSGEQPFLVLVKQMVLVKAETKTGLGSSSIKTLRKQKGTHETAAAALSFTPYILERITSAKALNFATKSSAYTKFKSLSQRLKQSLLRRVNWHV